MADHTKNSTTPFKYETSRQHIIDIVNKREDPKTIKWNIYNVPCNLRNLDNKGAAYTPQLVSIGPIHHGQKDLNPIMKDQKVRYLELFWSHRAENNAKDMDKFKKYLEDEETIIKIRQCYAENLCDNDKYNDEELVEMMLLDSVFIMELFLRIQSKNSFEDDFIVKQSWLNKSIQRDLLLLENQIPFFILKKLFKFVPDSDPVKEKYKTFIELARHYFGRFHANKKYDEETGSSDFKGKPSQLMMNCVTRKKGDTSSGENTGSSDSNTKHFTDLIRSFYIYNGLDDLKKESPSKPSRTATKLREAGVSFVKVKDKPLLEIKLQKVPIMSWFLCFGCIPHSTYFKARLQIPELKIVDTTECILRNLIAFEQCHYPDKPYICNYVSFIDSLIHTKDDVELLVEKEVIVHELGSHKEVATLVNSLCKHVVADKTCYIDEINSLDNHYQRQWNRTMAALRLVYFRDAWRASSTLVATAVLVFTIFNFWRVVNLVFDLKGSKHP